MIILRIINFITVVLRMRVYTFFIGRYLLLDKYTLNFF
jgi:hypothetical protein